MTLDVRRYVSLWLMAEIKELEGETKFVIMFEIEIAIMLMI